MIRQFKTRKEICDFYKLKEYTEDEVFKNKDILKIMRNIDDNDTYLVYENEIKTKERLTDIIHSLMLQNNLKDIFKEFRVSAEEEMIYCVFLNKKRVNKIKFSDIGVCDKLIFGRTKTRMINFFTFFDLSMTFI